MFPFCCCFYRTPQPRLITATLTRGRAAFFVGRVSRRQGTGWAEGEGPSSSTGCGVVVSVPIVLFCVLKRRDITTHLVKSGAAAHEMPSHHRRLRRPPWRGKTLYRGRVRRFKGCRWDAFRNADDRTGIRVHIDRHLISRLSITIFASVVVSTNCEISSIRLSAMALCGTMAATPITMS